MKLVIVESPTKAKTISRFLGGDYEVVSSYGHVRDLPKSELGVDVGRDFEPQYVIPTKARKVISTLKKSAAKADELVLATDEDREGEAIAWHISEALGLGDKEQIANGKSKKNDERLAISDKRLAISNKPVRRIVFHEITKPAIEAALEHPRAIDSSLVDAQQARRVLDRLVGYKLSPLLWKKVMRGLSAGRVQSVALRLIVERERERQGFVPQEYWTLEAELKTQNNETLKARLWRINGKVLKDLDLKSKGEIDKILASLEKAAWSVDSVSVRQIRRRPLAPFTTSTLQQEASRRLRLSAKQTMMAAQRLYEEGFITYMRTDSVNLSAESRLAAEKYIKENMGSEYSEPKTFKTKSRLAQEAHEAIRPTEPDRAPESVQSDQDPRESKLYELIWRRFVASQMTPAVFDQAAAVIETKTPYTFRAAGLTRKFDGFTRIWPQRTSETILPALKKGEGLALQKLLPDRHETEPPARYSEGGLVKSLEEYGVGRPSTYAPIMSTLTARRYVEKDSDRRFFPTEIGFIVNDLLVEHFPKIVDLKFTARLEGDLDDIAAGKKEWVNVVREFYEPFAETLAQKENSIKKSEVKKDIPTDKICPRCGKKLVIKIGRFGKFYACTGFPECKYTENFVEKIDMKCPECGQGEVVVKKSKKGRTFYGCSRWPECKYASWQNPKSRSDRGSSTESGEKEGAPVKPEGAP